MIKIETNRAYLSGNNDGRQVWNNVKLRSAKDEAPS